MIKVTKRAGGKSTLGQLQLTVRGAARLNIDALRESGDQTLL